MNRTIAIALSLVTLVACSQSETVVPPYYVEIAVDGVGDVSAYADSVNIMDLPDGRVEIITSRGAVYVERDKLRLIEWTSTERGNWSGLPARRRLP